jgi:RNA polymerase sigma-70 factor, ECF subfamily
MSIREQEITGGNPPQEEPEDISDFGGLFQKYWPLVFGSVNSRIHNPEQSEDLASEAFLKAWEKRAKFDPKRGSFHGWITTIAHNKVVDEQRRAGRARLRPFDKTLVEAIPDEYSGVEEEVCQRLDHEIFVQALPLNNDEQQRVLEQTLAGLSHIDIALEDGIPLGTVKSRIMLAKSKLHERLPSNQFNCLDEHP